MDKLICITLLMTLCGCGFDYGSKEDVPPKEVISAIDEAKLISTSIEDGRDPQSYWQRAYTISPESRLLVRYQKLKEKMSGIRDDKLVIFRIHLIDPNQVADARANMKICPVTKNWMMKATWKRAHPYKGGEWTPGGEVESAKCISSSSDLASTIDICKETGALCFDVHNWYHNYLLEQDLNYGMILISDMPIAIYGEISGSLGPRLHWFENKSPTK